MDTLTMIFYALVCGGLAALAPNFGSLAIRAVIGAVTGLVAAGVWPALHGIFG
jgi:hypothetical protein